MTISRLLIGLVVLQFCGTVDATMTRDNTITSNLLLTGNTFSTWTQSASTAQGRRSLQEYLQVTAGAPAILVVGTGEKYGVYDHMYYRIDSDPSVLPDYAATITDIDFRALFKGAFDIIIFERLPIAAWSDRHRQQAFLNAYHILKKGGMLVCNIPLAIQPVERTFDRTGLELVDEKLPGILYFRSSPFILYISEQSQFKSFQSDKQIEHQLLEILTEKLIKPLLLSIGFKEMVFETPIEAKPYWPNPKKNDRLLLKVVK